MEGTYAKANIVDVFTRALGLEVRDRVVGYVVFLMLIFGLMDKIVGKISKVC